MAHENTVLRKQLNRISFVGLKGIKVGDALAVNTWHFQEWTKETISDFEFRMIPEYDYRTEGEHPDKAFIFSYSHAKRADWIQKFHAVEGMFDHKAVIIAQKGKLTRNRYVTFIPFWYAQMHRLSYSPIVKRGICYKLCEALGNAREILRLIERAPQLKKIIFFHDVSSIDNILVQMCNQQKYITYTLQHGIINGAYDYVEYKCSHAKYFLAWGEYTKWVAMKYGMQESKIRVVGSMIQLNEKEENSADREKHNCFLVCTNGVNEKSAWNRNKEIIILANQIAEKYNMKYCLKVHPYDNINRYRRITKAEYCKRIAAPSERVEDLLKSVDFTLCGNSTTFCDSLYCKVPAFRYIEAKDIKIDACKGIKFGRIESYEQLEKSMTAIQKERSKYMIQLMKTRNLLFHAGDTPKEYVEAINGK